MDFPPVLDAEFNVDDGTGWKLCDPLAGHEEIPEIAKAGIVPE